MEQYFECGVFVRVGPYTPLVYNKLYTMNLMPQNSVNTELKIYTLKQFIEYVSIYSAPILVYGRGDATLFNNSIISLIDTTMWYSGFYINACQFGLNYLPNGVD